MLRQNGYNLADGRAARGHGNLPGHFRLYLSQGRQITIKYKLSAINSV